MDGKKESKTLQSVGATVRFGWGAEKEEQQGGCSDLSLFSPHREALFWHVKVCVSAPATVVKHEEVVAAEIEVH